jgi:hypothetical protein
MRIDASGNVGIGVTPSAWRSINRVLQIGTVANVSNIDATTNSGVDIGYNYFINSGGSPIYIISAASSYYRQQAGNHYWNIAPSGTAGNAITFTQAMTLDASGNLNITSPANTDSIATINSTNTNVSQRLNLTANGTVQAQLYNDSLQTILSSVTSIPLIFRTANTERMRIDSSGNVAIGTTTTSFDTGSGLRIQRANAPATIRLVQDGSGGSGFELSAANSNAQLDYRTGALIFLSAGTERMRIDSSGRVTTPFQPSFLVARDTTSISSGTFVVFQTTQNNVGSCYNTSNGTFTAPVAGLYSISFGFLASVSNTVYRFTIYRNNATFVVGSNVDPGQIRLDCSSGIDYLQGAKTLNIYLSANDYLNVHYSSDNGSALTDSTWAFFSGFLVG